MPQATLTRPQREACYIISELEFLRSCGVAWPAMCQQLGKTPCAMYRYLYRHGRPDLAAQLNRAVPTPRRAR